MHTLIIIRIRNAQADVFGGYVAYGHGVQRRLTLEGACAGPGGS